MGRRVSGVKESKRCFSFDSVVRVAREENIGMLVKSGPLKLEPSIKDK